MMPEVGKRYRVRTNDTQLQHLVNREVLVERVIDTPDDTHDAEALPMFVVRTDDGETLELWSDELT